MRKQKNTTRKAKNAANMESTHWDFFLYSGEWFARLSFPDAKTVRKLFPGAKVEGQSVYLA
jgi:hypothetical protein